ncbi:MAG: Fructose dehydrogenase cytochrome subunit [Stenotrophomonas maltophilia]|nr:MAG: Fructose dehydrogenase cytochrome subunit [Stenotrophomonas maltophilia]
MKTFYRATLLAVSLAGASSAALADDPAQAALIERGRTLAVAADCQACHRSKDDAQHLPFSGGYAIDSPMGAIVASNITPSLSQGIGHYSEAQFAAALRDGVRANGAHLYPAMPYTAYRGLSDADVQALYAYFMHGVTPVDQPVAETRLAFPFNQRWLMAGWNLLFLKGQPAAAAPVDTLARGRYLVDNLAHCGTCHTPRNALMAESAGSYLGGGSVGGWYAPNITSDPVSGIGAWSDADLLGYLRDGHASGKGQAGGGMAEAVEHSLRHLPDADLQAMLAYLRQVPPIRDASQQAQRSSFKGDTSTLASLEAPLERTPAALTDASSLDGERLYNGACASCHQPDGRGTAEQFYPSLSHNSATGDSRADNLVMAIAQGVERETNGYKVSMPAFAGQLSDAQIAAVSNYVLQRFGNASLKVDAQRVAELRHGGPTPWLVRATPWLMGLAAVVLALILLLGGRWLRRR